MTGLDHLKRYFTRMGREFRVVRAIAAPSPQLTLPLTTRGDR